MRGGGQLTPGATSGSRFYGSNEGQQPQFQVRTPVVSVYNNSYNISTLANSNLGDNNNNYSSAGYDIAPMGSVWTADEHRRFLDGLEEFGGSVGGGGHQSQGQAMTRAQNAWQSIAAVVRTRSLQEVKMHANRYFLELQLVNSQKRKEHLAMQTIDSRWTLEEDALFEHLLASHVGRGDAVCYAWEQIAAKIPNKTPRDVQERYHKLCYDIARIEAGHHVMMSYGRFSCGSSKASNSGGAGAVHPGSSYSMTAGMDQQQQHDNPGDSAQGPCDCVVTLTAAEEELLMQALEQVPVSPDAPPQVLTSIATAMAAIINSKNKRPPQRSQTLFTLEEARSVFNQLINNQNSHQQQQQQQYIDPRTILEEIVMKLRLQPRDQDPPPTRTSGLDQKLKPLATAGLAFTDDDEGLLTPRIYQASVHFAEAKSDFSQRGAVAEDLLSFRAASSRQGGGGGGGTLTLHSGGVRQPLFSPPSHSSSFSPMPPPSPYSHHFSSSYTPRDSRSSSPGDQYNASGGPRDGGRKKERAAAPSSTSAYQGDLEDY